VTIGATVVVVVVVVMVGATVVVVVVVAVEARQVVGAAAAQVIGAQVPPKIPHWTVHWAEHRRPAQGALQMLFAKKQQPCRVFDSSCWLRFLTTKLPDGLLVGLCEKMGLLPLPRFDWLGLDTAPVCWLDWLFPKEIWASTRASSPKKKSRRVITVTSILEARVVSPCTLR